MGLCGYNVIMSQEEFEVWLELRKGGFSFKGVEGKLTIEEIKQKISDALHGRHAANAPRSVTELGPCSGRNRRNLDSRESIDLVIRGFSSVRSHISCMSIITIVLHYSVPFTTCSLASSSSDGVARQ